MRSIACISILWIIFGAKLTAQTNLQPYIDSARTAYTNNDYANATRLYLRIVEHGYESAQIYYNIGNSYYKQMQIPKAIVWYQRALKLDPSFADAKYNLAMAQELIVDKTEVIAPPFYKRWYKELVTAISPNAWAYLTTGLFLLFILLLFISFTISNDRSKRLLFSIALFALMLSVLTFIVANTSHKRAVSRTIGVVTTPSVTVQSTPHAEGTKLFTIHEGITVTLSTYIEGWYEIRLDDGRVGWIQEKDIEEI